MESTTTSKPGFETFKTAYAAVKYIIWTNLSFDLLSSHKPSHNRILKIQKIQEIFLLFYLNIKLSTENYQAMASWVFKYKLELRSKDILSKLKVQPTTPSPDSTLPGLKETTKFRL